MQSYDDYIQKQIDAQDARNDAFSEWLENDYHFNVFNAYASNIDNNLGSQAIQAIIDLYQEDPTRQNPVWEYYRDLYELWANTEDGQEKLADEWDKRHD